MIHVYQLLFNYDYNFIFIPPLFYIQRHLQENNSNVNQIRETKKINFIVNYTCVRSMMYNLNAKPHEFFFIEIVK